MKKKDAEGLCIYEVYPRSFQDTNQDGVGDLPGITKRLSYIKNLGADYLWIAPFFRSPMKDFGYDVSDHYAVDPLFGTLKDFQKLIEQATKVGLKVMIDMVLSHTSDQHPWFLKSSLKQPNEQSNWYVWANAQQPNCLPNNWLSVFGGSAWTWHPQKQDYYLHNFLASQPDLNFHEPQVQNEVLNCCRFWLQQGVKGFRLDTVNYYFHDPLLRSNPELDKNALPLEVPSENPYGWQKHLFDKNQPENISFLQKIRALADQYDALLLGEVGDSEQTHDLIRQYTATEERLHLCYGFNYIGKPFRPEVFVQEIQTFWDKKSTSMICNAFGNHDSTRWMTRYKPVPQHKTAFSKLVLGLLGFLKGSFCLYQGEELGLEEYAIAFDEIQDPYGKAFYPKYKGRDGCRTPFVWEKNETYAGFTTAKKPWLPIAADHYALAVDQQEKKVGSPLVFVKKYLSWRKTQLAILGGSIEATQVKPALLQITRAIAGQSLTGYFNFSASSLPHSTLNAGRIVWSESASCEGFDAYGFLIMEQTHRAV